MKCSMDRLTAQASSLRRGLGVSLPLNSNVLAYLLKMPANFVPHYLMIQASSELTRPGTCLVYSWKELPAGFYRLNVTMTRDRIFPLKKCPFSAFLRSALRLFSLPRSAEKISTFRSHLTSFTSF